MLKIKYDGKDLSREQSRYEYLPSLVTLNPLEVLIGYYKPINSVFLNMLKNTGDRTVSLQYWAGEWRDVKGLKDLSFGLTSPGFVTWSRNQIGEIESTQAGDKAYWYRLTVNVPSTITFRGISALFSDDYDLVGVYPTIHNHLPEGQETFVRFHEEAAKDIITDLRRTGIVVNGRAQDKPSRKQLDAFDLLDKDEVREAAKYFALSKIFAWLSDSPADKWEILSAKFEAEAGNSLTPLITIDQDDDGYLDDQESAQPTEVFVGRL